MISRIATVLSTNKAMNHHLCSFLAAFQRATPFQGKVQRRIKQIIHGFANKKLTNKDCAIFLLKFKLIYFWLFVFLIGFIPNLCLSPLKRGGRRNGVCTFFLILIAFF